LTTKKAPAGKGGSTRRRRSRILAFRTLYRAEVAEDALADLLAEMTTDESVREDVRDFAVHLVSAVAQGEEAIDEAIKAALTSAWSLERLAVTDRCVLRMGTGELMFTPHQPVAVVLNESIEIARKFGTPDSGRFVNGVLDRVAKTLGEGENQGSRTDDQDSQAEDQSSQTDDRGPGADDQGPKTGDQDPPTGTRE